MEWWNYLVFGGNNLDSLAKLIKLAAQHKTMTIELANFLKFALEYGGEEAEILETYSGRGMFGRETVGIVFSSQTILLESILAYIKENPGVETQIPDFDKIQSDNMGRDVIYY